MCIQNPIGPCCDLGLRISSDPTSCLSWNSGAVLWAPKRYKLVNTTPCKYGERTIINPILIVVINQLNAFFGGPYIVGVSITHFHGKTWPSCSWRAFPGPLGGFSLTLEETQSILVRYLLWCSQSLLVDPGMIRIKRISRKNVCLRSIADWEKKHSSIFSLHG